MQVIIPTDEELRSEIIKYRKANKSSVSSTLGKVSKITPLDFFRKGSKPKRRIMIGYGLDCNNLSFIDKFFHPVKSQEPTLLNYYPQSSTQINIFYIKPNFYLDGKVEYLSSDFNDLIFSAVDDVAKEIKSVNVSYDKFVVSQDHILGTPIIDEKSIDFYVRNMMVIHNSMVDKIYSSSVKMKEHISKNVIQPLHNPSLRIAAFKQALFREEMKPRTPSKLVEIDAYLSLAQETMRSSTASSLIVAELEFSNKGIETKKIKNYELF